jgi:hypothetical protein
MKSMAYQETPFSHLWSPRSPSHLWRGRNDKVNGDQATEVTGGDRRQLPAHSLKSFEGDQVTDGAPQDAAPPHVDFASR